MKLIHKNKKAFFDYEILEQYTAGMVLTGPEVKSVRAGHINLKGAYVSVQGTEAFLKGAHISRYRYDTAADTRDPFRNRKLLLKESELNKIINHLNTQGVTVIPLEVALSGRHIKLVIAVARGKKKYDKRRTIKEREAKRDIGRAMRKH